MLHFMLQKFVDDEVMKSKICMMRTTTAQFSLCILSVWSVPILYDTTYENIDPSLYETIPVPDQRIELSFMT